MSKEYWLNFFIYTENSKKELQGKKNLMLLQEKEKSPPKPLTQSFSLMLENLELGSNVVRVY